MTELTETGAADVLAATADAFVAGATLLPETESGQENHVPADVQDVTSGGIVVSLPRPLEVGRTCTFRWGPATDRVIIHHCEKRPKGFLAVLRVVRQERRREERLRTAGTAMLCCEGPAGRRALSVSVTNISHGGLQVEMQEPVDVSRMVRLSGENFECVGLVCYCCRDGGRFLAGVRFARRPTIKRLPATFA
jgi:hypothetical protein